MTDVAPKPAPLWARLVATGLGSGLSPFAPGTAGSALGLALLWPLFLRPAWEQFAVLALVFAVGVPAATRVAHAVGRKDPGIVVVDEVVGMGVSLLLLAPTVWTCALAFFAFRAMDVIKPYPARALEGLPDGWGIMADDVAAGVYANLLVRLALTVWPG